MHSTRAILLSAGLLMLVTCANRTTKPVESIGGTNDVSRFTLTSLSGARSGEHLDAEAGFGDGSAALKVVLRFKVGVPTRLESGSWTGLGSGGRVAERSVTFLGGQSGPSSLGGRFDLVGPNGDVQYRITIPLRPLDRPMVPTR